MNRKIFVVWNGEYSTMKILQRHVPIDYDLTADRSEANSLIKRNQYVGVFIESLRIRSGSDYTHLEGIVKTD